MSPENEPAEPPSNAIKILVRLLSVIGSLALLVAVFYAEENVRGGVAWTKFKHSETANGESFDPADFVPPAVPDDQNFAMTPLLRTTFEYVHTKDGTRWRDTNAWQHLSNIRIDLGEGSGRTPPSITGRDQHSLVDLDEFANFYRGNTNYPQPAHPGSAAEDVLTAMNKFEPDLKELRDAAVKRPKSRFPIEYSHEPSFEILLPHLASVRSITTACTLRAIAELETHRTTDALADLQLSFRMADSVRDEPFLISHLVRIAAVTVTVEGIREGLARHAWNDAQLTEFETNLANPDLLTEYEHVMRGERSFNISAVDYFRRRGIKDIPLPENTLQPFGMALYWMPSGWYYRNMALMGQCYRDYILPSVDASNRLVLPGLGDSMVRGLDSRRPSPYNFLAKYLIPAFAKAAQRTARAQTTLDEAQVACALERYRLQNNQLPDTLSALMPQFIAKIPNDLFDGKSLRYKKDGNSYVLYSIGWNQQDDGGTPGLRTGSTPREDPNTGDWVWEYPAE